MASQARPGRSAWGIENLTSSLDLLAQVGDVEKIYEQEVFSMRLKRSVSENVDEAFLMPLSIFSNDDV